MPAVRKTDAADWKEHLGEYAEVIVSSSSLNDEHGREPTRNVFWINGDSFYLLPSRRASSAGSARSRMIVKKFGFVWPMKRPSASKPLKEASAPEFPVEVGRIMATGGNFRLSLVRKWVGSGMIRLACKVFPLRDSGFVSPWALARFVNVTVAPVPPGPLSTSVNGSALPALSCQV